MKSVVHHPVNIAITRKENQAVVEFNILKSLYPKFEKVDKCSIPRPVLVDPEGEAYVMEFVEGTLLGDEFRSARYFSSREKFETLKDHYYQCGNWLRYFQKFTGTHEEGPEALTGVMERCDYRLRLIEDLHDSRCPGNLREKVMGYLYEQLSQLKGEKISVSGRHGDFGSWNILVAPRGVTVIDYLGYGEDPISVDLLKMLMNFEDEKRYFAYDPIRITDLKKSFLEGYGSLPSISKPALVICETFHRVCSLMSSLSDNRGRLHHRIEKLLCLKANLKWLTDEKNRKLLWSTHNIQN
jgi:tRNA A-37 threonylcarbamoyl transferase component Bud32